MRFYFALLMILVLPCCRWESDTYCDPREKMLPLRPDQETMFYQHEICKVINTYATKLDWLHQIWLENCYANYEEDGQFYIFVDFSTQDNLDLPEARRMSVLLIEGLLKALNENQLLVAHQNGPFTPDNLYFSIEYTSFYGKYIDILLVGRTELKYGYLNVFYAHDAFMLDPVIYHKHSEPYETSKCIVAAEFKELKKLKPTAEFVYDRMLTPEKWTSGVPDYILKHSSEEYKPLDFSETSAVSNYPINPEQAAGNALSAPASWDKAKNPGVGREPSSNELRPESNPPVEPNPPPESNPPVEPNPPPDQSQSMSSQ